MKKLNLLNAEESAKVKGGKRNPDNPIESCGTFDVKYCLVDYFPDCEFFELPITFKKDVLDR